MRINVDPAWIKPVLIQNTEWKTTDPDFKVLTTVPIMNAVFTQNSSFKNLMRSFAYARIKACVHVSLTGTLTHSGIVLASVAPNWQAAGMDPVGSVATINSMLSQPHAFLAANEASSVCIEVPFYCPCNYISINATSGADPSVPSLFGNKNYAALMLKVLNKLSVGDGGSTTLTIQTIVEIKEMELYVPTPGSVTWVDAPAAALEAESLTVPITKGLDSIANVFKTTTSDFIDGVRSTIKRYTGLHNPNDPVVTGKMVMTGRNMANQIDLPTFYEKLDPDGTFSRICNDSYFMTDVDEMEMSHILGKPQYIGRFKITNAYATGRLLYAAPISPYQGAFGTENMMNNIEMLALSTRAWSGDMELIIQSSMTNKQNCKLIVARLYGLDRTLLTKFPDLNSARMGITNVLEFSGGNQQQTVTLDYLSRNEVLYVNLDTSANALTHGMYYIFLAQPLVISDNTPTEANFNIYMRCKENFRLYGYSTVGAAVRPFSESVVPPGTFTAESTDNPVMNMPNVEQPLLETEQPIDKDNDHIRMKPILHLRDLIRRMQFVRKLKVDPGTDGVSKGFLDIAELLELKTLSTNITPMNINLMHMYNAILGGVKIKLVSNSADFNVSYIPPTLVSGNQINPSTTDFFLPTFYDTTLGGADRDGQAGCFPFVELPHNIFPDFLNSSQRTGIDVHIPMNSMYKFNGNSEWAANSLAVGTFLTSNFGQLVYSATMKTGNPLIVYVYMGFDDETRLGQHTMAPFLQFKTNSTGANKVYDVALQAAQAAGTAKRIKVKNPTCYYSNNPIT